MVRLRGVGLYLAFLIAGLPLVGCGGSSPTSPSGAGKVVLHGVAVGADGASTASAGGVTAQAASKDKVTVTVQGTSISTTVSANGTFELEGQQFMALNAGPLYKFTEAISFFVGCETQEEIDELWTKLTVDGGAPSRCGWLKDKFGLSWQVVPTILPELLQDKDPEKSKRVMQAMLKMVKIDINELEDAYAHA